MTDAAWTGRIFLRLAYEGTNYSGWQIQKNGGSIQEELEKALAAVQKQPGRITASGRTDAGVHARGQVAHFQSLNLRMPPEKFTPALNAFLPRDIRVLESYAVDGDKHARYSARVRIYHYYLRTSPLPALPWEAPYCWTLRHRPDILRLNAMAGVLPGVHDFSAFAALGDPSPSKVREIFSCGFFPWSSGLVFRIAGNAFLWHMVRNLVGTLVELERQGKGAGEVSEILAGRDRSAAGATAPAKGLFLEKVLYSEPAFF